MDVAMNFPTNIDPTQLELPFFLFVVGMTYVCGLLLFAQLL
jgi:hypothetical protein